MKLTKWFLGAMALCLTTACSDNDLASKGENGQDDGGLSSTGYIAVEIKLPQETGATRADGEKPGGENDNYADGEATEYAVENAMIVLFKGSKESGEKNAKFYRAQDLKKPFFNNAPEDDGISSSYMAAIEVMTPPTESENLWALVIINRNGDSTKVNEPDADGNNSVTIGNKVFTTANTFADVLNQTTSSSFLVKTGEGDKSVYRKFFMTNAPLSTAKGGFDADPSLLKPEAIRYLTDLGNKVYATPDEAKQNVSGCVYVERAVAKVTYKDGKLAANAIQLKFHKMDQDGNPVEYAPEEYSIDANVTYALTNTNKTSYVVRNVEFDQQNAPFFNWALVTNDYTGVPQYRMVGNTPMPKLSSPFHQEQQNLFRTYWCLDPNYSKPMGASGVDGEGKDELEDNGIFYSLNMPLYCKENTFNVQNQNYANTTLAIFKVDLNIKIGDKPVDHLFIRNGDKSKIYLTKEDAGADEITRIAKDPNIQNAMKQSLKTGFSEEEYSVTKHLDIVLERLYDNDGNPIDNNLVVKEIRLKLLDNDKWFDEASIAKFAGLIGAADVEGTIHNDLLRTVNQLNEITEYASGVSYYALPIKHFGDYYTPWDNSIKGTQTNEVYNGSNAFTTDEHAHKYLGRYGMVRNNWYELNITKIINLGVPSIEEIDKSYSDDNNEDKKYFAVEIHTLSWAKRTQKTEF